MTSSDSKLDFETRLKHAAMAAHAELLDDDWRGWGKRYRLRCAAGHVWSRTASQIVFRQPVTCPECKKAEQLARLATTVEQNGSVCLDTVWRGCRAKYHFRCTAGHLWERCGRHVLMKNGATGCPQCGQKATNAKKRLADGLEKLRAAAAARGGECLADRYLGRDARYRFRCREGHEWESIGNAVLCGTWCPRCSLAKKRATCLDIKPGKRLPDGLAKLRAAAAARGGECLADRDLGVSARYRFRCREGHEWDAVGYTVLHGRWCPRCNHEKISAAYLDTEGLTRLHAAAAAKGGVCLSLAYTGRRARYRFRCAQGHEWETRGDVILLGRWCPRCVQEAQRTDIAVFQTIAAERGGKCLSPAYLGRNVKLTLTCHRGHVWQTLPTAIKQGRWCPECANEARLADMSVFQAIAAERGGECLSTEYFGQNIKLTWMCHRGHVWQARPANIKRGHWCPECAHAANITRADSKARMRYGKAPKASP